MRRLIALFLGGLLAGCLDPAPIVETPADPHDALALLLPDHVAFANPPSREFDLAARPGAPLAMSYVHQKTENTLLFWSGIGWSDDNGQTWRIHEHCGDAHSTNAPEPVCPFRGAAGTSDPSVYYLLDGSLMNVGVMLRGEDVEIYAAQFAAGAAKPQSVTTVARSPYNHAPGLHQAPTPYGVYYNGKPNMLVDQTPNRLHMAWSGDLILQDFAMQDMIALPVWSTSNDNGRTWSTPKELSGTRYGDPAAPFANGITPLQGKDGRLHAIWWDGQTNALYQVTSADGGATFSPARKIGDAPIRSENQRVNWGAATRPWTAVDRSDGPHGGGLYVSFEHRASGDRNVYVLRSTDHGTTWSEPLLASRPEANRTDETFSRLHVAADGTVYVLYSRSLGSGQGSVIELARSRDGATTFEHLVLSSNPSPGRPGDYNAIATTDSALVALWADSQGGRATAHSAAVALPQT